MLTACLLLFGVGKEASVLPCKRVCIHSPLSLRPLNPMSPDAHNNKNKPLVRKVHSEFITACAGLRISRALTIKNPSQENKHECKVCKRVTAGLQNKCLLVRKATNTLLNNSKGAGTMAQQVKLPPVVERDVGWSPGCSISKQTPC